MLRYLLLISILFPNFAYSATSHPETYWDTWGNMTYSDDGRIPHTSLLHSCLAFASNAGIQLKNSILTNPPSKRSAIRTLQVIPAAPRAEPLHPEMQAILDNHLQVQQREQLERESYNKELLHALREGTLSGFSHANKDVIRKLMLVVQMDPNSAKHFKQWKVNLLQMFSEGGAMLGFTEDNKMAIFNALYYASSVHIVGRKDSDEVLIRALAFFDHQGEGLTWSQEEKVEMLEGLRSPPVGEEHAKVIMLQLMEGDNID